VWRAMRPYARQVAGLLSIGSLCGVVMNTAVVLPAVLLGHAIDVVVAHDHGRASSAAVTQAAVLLIGGTLATELPRVGKRFWLGVCKNRIRANVRADALRGVLSWPAQRLHTTSVGEVMARVVGDVEVLGTGVGEVIVETWDTLLFSVSLIVVMLVYDPTLAVLALHRWATVQFVEHCRRGAKLLSRSSENVLGTDTGLLFAQRLYDAGEHTVAQIAGMFTVPRSTVYGHLDKATVGARPRAQKTVPTSSPSGAFPSAPRMSRACPSCGHDPRTREEATTQRADLAVTWLCADPDRPGQVLTRRHCRRCQPHTPVADIACVVCGDGPIFAGALAAAATGAGAPPEPVQRWLAAEGWQLTPELLCPDHRTESAS